MKLKLAMASGIILLWVALSSSAQEANFKLSKVVIESEVNSIMSAKWNDDFVHVSYPEQCQWDIWI